MQTYEIAVLGGGPAGYVAAIRAAKEGKRTALIEAGELGGTCLNRGCIPSKTLLHHAWVIEQIGKARKWGIETGELTLSLEKMMARKDQVVKRLQTGIASLLKAGRIELFAGRGQVRPDKTIDISSESGSTTIRADAIVLATGSAPAVPPIPGLAATSYYTSDTIFSLQKIPETLAIIGGGIIGVEFASMFAAFGARVTVIEMADRLVPQEDADAAEALAKAFRKKGVRIATGTKVASVAQQQGKTLIRTADADGQPAEFRCDALLVAAGRTPNLTGVEELRLEMDGPFIKVDAFLETSVPGIYAAGDVIGGWQLAHAASAEGQIAALNACGGREAINYRTVPRCVYTHPEIASVGLSEREAAEQGYRVKTAVYPHAGNGKALAEDDYTGFTKLIAEETYGEVLGVVMVGPHVTEMIAAGSAFIHTESTVEEMAGMIYAHPTISESLMEVAAKWRGKGIHS
ncbi:dihydrolipoyl dehydrogenase [Brevibacillus sp. WF146]|uniref:dihydrolipoyl dehydrogenase n=1 Tax=Brevibacillus sp. WF146 TaxID=319501 RepID=UPI0007ED3611|nr:dihydrolipoyl dehydrogenase [Brevibacillus sp. WF146]UYZ12258.1 dihydrolipoyl dehydrogenase [Brevibacillus sp. WF146]